MIERVKLYDWMPSPRSSSKVIISRDVRQGKILPYIYKYYFSDREAKEYMEYAQIKVDFPFNINEYSYFGFKNIHYDPEKKIISRMSLNRLLETDFYIESNIIIHPDLCVYRYVLNFVTNRAYLYNNLVMRFRPWVKPRNIVLACTNSTRDKLYSLRDELHKIYPYTVSVIDLDYIEDRASYGYENCWQLWSQKKDVEEITHDKKVKFRRQHDTVRSKESA